jgi:rhomboid family GlyGly-CTERM serine protease
MHFLFNLFGLIILWLIIADWLGNRDAILVMGISMLLISLGLYYIYPEVQWYRGLSGALHALWSAAAFLGLERRRTMAIPLLALLLIKLGWEVTIGPLPLSREISGGDVLIQSHWLGAVSGLLVAAGYMILKLFKSRSPI